MPVNLKVVKDAPIVSKSRLKHNTYRVSINEKDKDFEVHTNSLSTPKIFNLHINDKVANKYGDTGTVVKKCESYYVIKWDDDTSERIRFANLEDDYLSYVDTIETQVSPSGGSSDNTDNTPNISSRSKHTVIDARTQAQTAQAKQIEHEHSEEDSDVSNNSDSSIHLRDDIDLKRKNGRLDEEGGSNGTNTDDIIDTVDDIAITADIHTDTDSAEDEYDKGNDESSIEASSLHSDDNDCAVSITDTHLATCCAGNNNKEETVVENDSKEESSESETEDDKLVEASMEENEVNEDIDVDETSKSSESSEDEKVEPIEDLEKVKLQQKVIDLERQEEKKTIAKVKHKAADELVDLAIQKGMIDEDDRETEILKVSSFNDEGFARYESEVIAFCDDGGEVTSLNQMQADTQESITNVMSPEEIQAQNMLAKLKFERGISSGSQKLQDISQVETRYAGDSGYKTKVTFDNKDNLQKPPSFEEALLSSMNQNDPTSIADAYQGDYSFDISNDTPTFTSTGDQLGEELLAKLSNLEGNKQNIFSKQENPQKRAHKKVVAKKTVESDNLTDDLIETMNHTDMRKQASQSSFLSEPLRGLTKPLVMGNGNNTTFATPANSSFSEILSQLEWTTLKR